MLKGLLMKNKDGVGGLNSSNFDIQDQMSSFNEPSYHEMKNDRNFNNLMIPEESQHSPPRSSKSQEKTSQLNGLKLLQSKVLKATQFLKLTEQTVQEAKQETKGSLNNLIATDNSVRSQLNKALRKLKYEHPLKRSQLIEVCLTMNLHMSYLQATEAILYYRGKDLENSENYEVDKLIRWLKENIKLLRPIKKPELESQNFVPSGKSLLNKSVNIERSSLNGRQALSSQPNIRKSVKLEQFSNMIRGSQENMQLPSLKGQLNQSREFGNMRNYQSTTASTNPLNQTQNSLKFNSRNLAQDRGRFLNSHQQNQDRYFDSQNQTTQRTKLEYDRNFQQEMQTCISNLKRIIKNNINQRININIKKSQKIKDANLMYIILPFYKVYFLQSYLADQLSVILFVVEIINLFQQLLKIVKRENYQHQFK